MTNEARQRAMDFIVEQQAKFSVEIEQLNGSYRKSEHRFDRDERILKLIIKAGRRTRRHVREMDERFEQRFAKLTDALTALAGGQAQTDRRLDALIDIVREGRNGRS